MIHSDRRSFLMLCLFGFQLMVNTLVVLRVRALNRMVGIARNGLGLSFTQFREMI